MDHSDDAAAPPPGVTVSVQRVEQRGTDGNYAPVAYRLHGQRYASLDDVAPPTGFAWAAAGWSPVEAARYKYHDRALLGVLRPAERSIAQSRDAVPGPVATPVTEETRLSTGITAAPVAGPASPPRPGVVGSQAAAAAAVAATHVPAADDVFAPLVGAEGPAAIGGALGGLKAAKARRTERRIGGGGAVEMATAPPARASDAAVRRAAAVVQLAHAAALEFRFSERF